MPQCLHVITKIKFEVWQFTFFMLYNFLPVVVEMKSSDLSISGQYLQVLERLQGLRIMLGSVLLTVLVEARTS